jgi:hypothetical protein
MNDRGLPLGREALATLRIAALAIAWLVACSGSEPPEIPPAAGTPIPVTGTLHDDQNHPIPEAEVVLYRMPRSPERTKLHYSGSLWPEPEATARAGADGSFRLLAPGPDSYVVIARAPGRVPMESPLWPLLEATDVGTARLFPDRACRVRVVDTEHSPVAGAAVATWSQPNEGGWRAPYGPGFWRRPQLLIGRTSAEGEVRLSALEGEPFGAVFVVAGGRFARLDLESPEQRGEEPVVVALEDGPALRIDVRRPDGAPAADTAIYGRTLIPIGITGSDGSFELRSPFEEPLHLSFYGPGDLLADATFEPVGDAPRRAFRVVLKRWPEIVGRVVDALTGNPVPAAWVMEMRNPAGVVRTDPRGRFRLPVREASRAWISADAVGYDTSRATVSSDSALHRPLVMRLVRRTEEGPVIKRYSSPGDGGL